MTMNNSCKTFHPWVDLQRTKTFPEIHTKVRSVHSNPRSTLAIAPRHAIPSHTLPILLTDGFQRLTQKVRVG